MRQAYEAAHPERPSVAEFLLARIAEQEASLRQLGNLEYRFTQAEIEAKRRLVERCDQILRAHISDDFAADHLAEDTLKYLALGHADHWSYREEWRG